MMEKKWRHFFRNYPLLVIICVSLSAITGCREKAVSPFSKSAEESLSTFEIAPGFKIELIASEPLINDPVAMTVDESGRMYVVEMVGMPLNKSGIGKVILLSDTSHDGKMDKSTVFADSLIMPSGIMRWKKGVIVTDPPKVYYMEDSNGDGIADIKKLMLDGFDTSNLEGNVNNPIYGLDNWIYLASLPVIKGGNIHYADDSTSARLEEGSVRFRPDLHEIETISGISQFGHTFDAWGNYLGLNNHYHAYQEMIPSRYLKRNPDLLVSRATQLLPDHSEVFSITKNPEYQMLTEIGVFTSACGLTDYLGGAFPEAYNTNVTFVGEPASNIVHVDRLKDSGVTFKANRIVERKEFLASTDPFCRMVNLYIGPDGALYIIDFYREVIEGPEFMSEEIVKKVDLYNGKTKGRIYRVTAEGAAPADWTDRLHLGDATISELVENLDNKNIWWRINSQRLLVDKKADSSVSLLVAMTNNDKAPMGRLHALWTLEGINALTPDLIMKALKDPLPGMRVNAIKLAELHLAADQRLAPALLAMENDPDPKVRFQLVCTLGFINSAEADKARQDLLFKDIDDKWVQIAALSAGSSQSLALLNGVLSKFDPSIKAYASLVQLLGGIIGKSQDASVIRQLIHKSLTDSSNKQGIWQASLLKGLSEGFTNRKSLPAELGSERKLLIGACLQNPLAEMRKSCLDVLKVIGLPAGSETNTAMLKAEEIAGNTKLDQAVRAGAIDFMALKDPGPYGNFLKGLINLQTPILVQLSAIRALGAIPGEEVTKYLLQKWPALTPEIRGEAIEAFFASDERVKLLLDKIESGEINKGAISWDQSVRIRSEGKYMIRARRLLTETDVKRKDVIGQYQDALKLKGDAEKGKTIYQTNCAICHQFGGKFGISLGPDLGTVHAWATADILTNILDPNRSIALGFDMWLVKLSNGKSIQGIISSETPTAITLVNTQGEATNISREDISSLSALQMSAMPIDFEKKIDKQQMADLLAFLKEIK
ncbi:MAG: PVC-type heme-binding CxxCH protein [Ginsengibacter sp.]